MWYSIGMVVLNIPIYVVILAAHNMHTAQWCELVKEGVF